MNVRSYRKLMRNSIIILFLALLTSAASVRAQNQTTVRIQDEGVFLNGRKLASGEFPVTLQTRGQNSQFTFTGDARFYVAGRMYGVENNRIVEVPRDVDDSFVVLFRAEDAIEEPMPAGELADIHVKGSPGRTFRSFARVLDDRAERMDDLRRQFTTRDDVQLSVVAERMQREAEESAVVLRAFPRIEMQTYLEGLQGRDSMLYERLMDELQMESETAQLAASIIATEGPRRIELEQNLRRQLDRIFELKQQNRRDEISQLEKQLAELRSQLNQRESNRRAIIDRRLEQLIGPVRR